MQPIESTRTLALDPTARFRIPLLLSERRLILLGLDLAAVNAALVFVLTFRGEHRLGWGLASQHPLWFILLSSIWILLAYALDAYDLREVKRIILELRLLKAAALTILIYLLIPYLTPGLPTSRLTLVAFPVVLVALVLSGRGLYSLTMVQPFFCRRVLIIGAGRTGQTIAQSLYEHGVGMYELVGFVDDDRAKQDSMVRVEVSSDGDSPTVRAGTGSVRVLGDYAALDDTITRYHVNTLVHAIPQVSDGKLFQVLMDCLERGVELLPMSVLYEQLTGRVPIEHVGDDWYVAMPVAHVGTTGLYPLVKRLMDAAVAFLSVLFLGIATPLIALAVYLDSRGPIFYWQWRVGKGGRLFKVFKFRSMVPNAEQGRALWAQKKDYRVTRVGRFLRATHIDEFPQFLNVLKGEMSLVGPRPERPEFVAELSQQIPFYRVRLAVKPGMAGWGLVKQGYGASKDDAVRKLQYDLYWIKHQSLWLDLVILLKTIGNTLSFAGR